MNNKKSTKRALLSSVLSLVLCMAMLIGTTFAWFTDSVSSTNNIIKSGNLDVELEYSTDMNNWNKVTETTNIFKEGALWEPGYTEVVYLRVSNLGSLALKYNLGVNVISETPGTNKAGESFNLSNYIEFGVIDPVTAAFSGRDVARAAVTDAKKIATGYTKEGTLTAGQDPNVVAMVVYMPESVGNEANHNGNAPEIKLGLNLFATQLASEIDSFDNQYDKDAVYADAYVTDATELADAIAKGGTIALMNDIEVTTISVPKGVNATINLNGNDIIGTSTKDSGNQYAIQVKGNLTVEGTGVVSHVHTGANMGWNNLTAAFSVEGGTLTLGEGVSVVNNGGSDMAYAVDVNSTLGETVLNVEGATIYSTYTGVRLFSNNKTQAAIVNFNKGFIEGENRDIWNQIASASIPAENGVVNIADGYNYTTEATSNGGAKYFFTDYLVATDDDGLDDAIKEGATTLVLSSGNYIIPDSAQGKTLTIVGSGDTVIATQDDGSYEGCDYSLDGAKVTFENITINTDSRTYTGYARCSATYNNCTINGAYTLYGESVFNNCTFNVTGDTYNIWTWGAKTVKFNGCTFNTDGKSILVYNQTCDVYVDGCTFNDRTNGTGFTKSAFETGVDGVGPKYNIYINNTTVNGFAENDQCVGYKNIVGNKNSITNEYLNIVIDGVDVY